MSSASSSRVQCDDSKSSPRIVPQLPASVLAEINHLEAKEIVEVKAILALNLEKLDDLIKQRSRLLDKMERMNAVRDGAFRGTPRFVHYEFQAKRQDDLDKFKALLTDSMWSCFGSDRSATGGLINVTLTSSLSIEQLRGLMRQIPDSQLMSDSLKLTCVYRKSDCW